MRVLILGAGGIFGQRVARELSRDPDFFVIAGGRREPPPANEWQASVAIDSRALDFAAQLRAQAVDLLIHCAGPFQGADYAVARAAIACGVHYVDLADGRDFVCGIDTLDQLARERGVLVTSGASSVPALNAAAVDALTLGWREIHTISTGITPGNQTPRGLATVRSILSYVGKPHKIWHEGRWQVRYGWGDGVRERYAEPIGERHLANCDVPDLELFPERYPSVSSVRFRAGLELKVLHHGLALLGTLVRIGWAPDMQRFAAPLKSMSELLLPFGSNLGAMNVTVTGLNAQGIAQTRRLEIDALNGDGPQIPATAAVVLARKLKNGELSQRGALPCMGLLTLAEYLEALADYAIEARYS